MSEPLPEMLDPRRAVGTGATFAGEMPLSQMPRLRPLLHDTAGLVRYRLRFERDARGLGVVAAEIEASLPLRCQRCNGALLLPVSQTLALALVEGLDEADRLPPEYEPLLVEERLLRSRDLIEDELILAVPAIPRHATGVCAAPGIAGAGGPEAHGQDGTNPFSVLATLKTRKPH